MTTIETKKFPEETTSMFLTSDDNHFGVITGKNIYLYNTPAYKRNREIKMQKR